MARPLKYEPALDGLRAIAVTAVLVFHDETLQVLRGGFLGVDIFFVLSGFLITSILLARHDESGATVSRDFWHRRARRLVPAFLLFMVGVSLATLAKDEPWTHARIRHQGLWAFSCLANWRPLLDLDRLPSQFGHLWSLAVEEQWYVVWPFLLALLLRVTAERLPYLLAAGSSLAAASASFMWYYAAAGRESAAFLATQSRVWELLAGALLSFVHWHRPGRAPWVRGMLDLAAVPAAVYLGWAFVHLENEGVGVFPGHRIFAVVATITLLAASLQPRSVVRRVLGWRPLALVGLVSYGMYLYHLPLYPWLTATSTGVSGVPLSALRFCVVLAVAGISYRWIEKPIREGALRRAGVNGLVVTMAAYSVVVGLFLYATRPPERNLSAGEALALAGYRQTANRTPAGVTRVLVAGDATAFRLGQFVDKPIDFGGIRGATVATLGCGIAPGAPYLGVAKEPNPKCGAWTSLYREATHAFRPHVAVLLLGEMERFDRHVGGRVLRVGSTELEVELLSGLEAARSALASEGRRLILLLTLCPGVEGPASGERAAADLQRRAAWLQGVWKRFADRHPRDVSLADASSVFCSVPDRFATSVGGPQPSEDGGDRAKAEAFWRWLAGLVVPSHRT